MLTWFSAIPVLGALLKILSSIIDGMSPLLKGLSEFVVGLFKTFIEGLKVVFDNKSTLLVILVCMITSGWYFRTWNDKTVVQECEKQIEYIEKTVPKKYMPSKNRKGEYKPKTVIEKFRFPDVGH